jgi:hypothetical protein
MDPFWDLLDKTVGELCALSGHLPFALAGTGITLPTIEFLDSSYELPFDLEELLNPHRLPIHGTLRISLDVEKATIAEASEFGKRLNELVYVANLARVGSFGTGAGIVAADGKTIYALHGQNPHLLREHSLLKKSYDGWPPLCPLEIAKVWDWAQRQEGFSGGFGGGPLGRALNAYTLFFGYPAVDEIAALFWAMIGIESLYTRGKQAISKQLREKIWAFLGKQEGTTQIIWRMYDFRSKFVHGCCDFAGRDSDAEPPTESDDKLLEASSLAVAILAATLQKLAAKDWSDLDFPVEPTI